MLKSYLLERNKLSQEVSFKERLDALLGAFTYATLFFLPVFLILAEILIVYFYLLYPLVILLIFAFMLYVVVMTRLYQKALLLKKPDLQADMRKITFVNQIIINSIVLVIGLLILFVMIPYWMI